MQVFPPTNPSEKDVPRTFTTVAVAFLSLFASSATAIAEIRTVCASGCQYTSINAAIDDASDGDVIQLSAETYTEGEVIDTDGKAITLLGTTDKSGAPTSILDGVGNHQVLRCTTDESSTTVLKNLHITRGFDPGGAGGLEVDRASPSVFNCYFVLNSSFLGGGLFALESRMSLEGCWFENNDGGAGAGAFLQDSNVTMHGCTFSGNTAVIGGSGAVCLATDEADGPISCTFTDCTFVGNIVNGSAEEPGTGAGMTIENCFVVLVDCRFSGNLAYDGLGPALYILPSESGDDDGRAVIYNSTFCANATVPSSPDQILGNHQVLGDGNCIAVSCDDCSSPVQGDLDGDGVVDASDFVHLRTLIGVDALGCVAADINGDGQVDGADLAYVLGYWGLCSAP